VVLSCPWLLVWFWSQSRDLRTVSATAAAANAKHTTWGWLIDAPAKSAETAAPVRPVVFVQAGTALPRPPTGVRGWVTRPGAPVLVDTAGGPRPHPHRQSVTPASPRPTRPQTASSTNGPPAMPSLHDFSPFSLLLT
jgi:hypothetical protein